MQERGGEIDRRTTRLPSQQRWSEYVTFLLSRREKHNSSNELTCLSQSTDYTVPALDIDMPEVHSTFETNLFAVMRMCTAFSPLLIRTRGTIVQIGSVAGIIPYVWGSVYNASKAALHLYSATLRVELAPFGVQVITVITGGVKSNIARTHRTLREGSLMEPLADKYARRLKHSQEVGMPTEQYGQDVVRQVLNSRGYLWNTKEIWAGSGGRLVWWVKTLFPEGTWDIYMTREFGLSRLAETQDKKDL